ncbi:Planctomycete cytochrome C [Stieleria neptunia]|uniref:Planctomycete cytochrome C n=1 Tax=Stieleria neptunia TaxID=2527979 RepID=A0A518HY46_9BACT|nr:DUF1553 domain-containing protein [Stieleria neptunia]QDV45770.1 Planctomycete cytochrome C [Stieleria neptunia]
MLRLFRFFFPIILAAPTVMGTSTDNASADEPLQFNRDIRPILSENCYHCHGPDASAREAELRLDTEEGAKEWAVVSGEAESSELVARIFSDDPDTLMPPADSERALTEKQKQLLRRWVNEGASYQAHWSFQTPLAQRVPAVAGDRAVNPIDHFIFHRLQTNSLQLAPAADKETLLRRITFDLIGLPPTIAELDHFLADTSPRAIEKVIDRLLADSRYGERMAADWLDVARYSDTYGYQVDRDRFVWPYRDWVVDAFNRNLGYDHFLRQQLAGDLLPDPSRDQILATTFNRLHPQKVEGGSVPEEFRIEYVADRTQTVSTAFLGLTMECCRCHSHKYDPITQTEYYQLSAFFANIDEAGLYSFFTPSIPTPTLGLPNDAQAVRLSQLQRDIDSHLASYHKACEKQIDIDAYRDLLDTNAAPSDPTETPASAQASDKSSGNNDNDTDPVDRLYATPIESLDFESPPSAPNQSVPGIAGNAVRLTGDDVVNLKTGNFRRDQPFSVSLWIKTPDVKDRAVVFHRSRAWTDAASRGYQLLIEDGHLSWSLIHFWPGNAIRIRTPDPIPVNQWVHVVVTNDGSSSAGGLSIAIDGQRVPAVTVRDHLTKQITGGGGDNLAIGQRFRDRGFTSGEVDSFRVFDCELTDLEIQRLARRDESLTWVRSAPQDWTPAQRHIMSDHLLRRHDADLAQHRERLGQARRVLCQLQDQIQEIMVMKEAPGVRTTYRLERGAYDAPAEAVTPGTPKAILGLDDSTRKDRLGLADWMLRPDHPLTSRVAVNRIWQLCFGVGLVRTPEDFGSQGEPPTHPELLDWLAIDFVNSGWDIKRLIKQIMMSATYQASSEHPDPAVWNRDPENRWLSRHNAYRLPAEMLRDQALALSGQLVSKLGGPPVKPYEVEASFKPSKRDSGEGLYRRSIYTYWKRTGPAPAMMTLDAAKRDVCRVRRERTSSPLQAFVLLNGPQYVESARVLAFRLITEQGDDADAVLLAAFRTLTSRYPTDAETRVVSDLYADQLAYFRQHPDRAKEYLSVGEIKFDKHDGVPSSDQAALAATAVVIGTLMNYDESVMKR